MVALPLVTAVIVVELFACMYIALVNFACKKLACTLTQKVCFDAQPGTSSQTHWRFPGGCLDLFLFLA